MREKMHNYFEQQQNGVSVMSDKSQVSAAANVQVVVQQEKTKVEQNKAVSVIIEMKEVVNARAAPAKVQVVVKQKNNKVSVVIEKKERPNTRVNKNGEKGTKLVNIRQKRKNKISIISVVIGMKRKIKDIRVKRNVEITAKRGDKNEAVVLGKEKADLGESLIDEIKKEANTKQAKQVNHLETKTEKNVN